MTDVLKTVMLVISSKELNVNPANLTAINALMNQPVLNVVMILF